MVTELLEQNRNTGICGTALVYCRDTSGAGVILGELLLQRCINYWKRPYQRLPHLLTQRSDTA